MNIKEEFMAGRVNKEKALRIIKSWIVFCGGDEVDALAVLYGWEESREVGPPSGRARRTDPARRLTLPKRKNPPGTHTIHGSGDA